MMWRVAQIFISTGVLLLEGGVDMTHEYYILVVKPRIMGDEYERIGVGMVHANYVSRERVDVRIV